MKRRFLYWPTFGDEHSDVAGVMVELRPEAVAYLRRVLEAAVTAKATLGPDMSAVVAASPACYYVGHDFSWRYDPAEDETPPYEVTNYQIGEDTYNVAEMAGEPEADTEWTMENNPRVRVYPCGDIVFAGYYKYTKGEESSELISLEVLAELTGATEQEGQI